MMHPMLKKKTHFTIAVLELYKSEIHSPRLASPQPRKKKELQTAEMEKNVLNPASVARYRFCFISNVLFSSGTAAREPCFYLFYLYVCTKPYICRVNRNHSRYQQFLFLLKNCYMWVMSAQRMVYISNVNPNKKYYIWVITHLRLVHSRGQRINN